MSKEFIISDTFFGRRGAINKFKRPFEDVDDMNQKMIDSWNEIVGPDDIVWHLGNLAWDPIICERVLSELNGHINLIRGDYDDAAIENSKFFTNITIMEEQIYNSNKHKAVFCHYPLADWPGKKKGAFHFHGHSIGSFKTDLNEMNRVNITCDNWGYKPKEISDLYNLFRDFKKSKEKL